MNPRTLFDKIWDAHVVVPETDETPAVLYVDLHLLHEVTSPQAFTELARRKMRVRRPDRCLATMDHSTPTLAAGSDGMLQFVDAAARAQVETLRDNCAEHGIDLLGLGNDDRGIVHVIGPELGASQPGMVIVCGDSHTSSHGAMGGLAFGIGTTEVSYVLATQCLLQRKPKSMVIDVVGDLGVGVLAKDLILHIIGQIGGDGGIGHVIEYRGDAVRTLTIEGRLTMCNMSIEAGARSGMIAPDEHTFDYLRGRPRSPRDWQAAIDSWQHLASDDDASFDRSITIDAAEVVPTITYGTSPAMVVGIDGCVPSPTSADEVNALAYMDLHAGERMTDRPIDVVFVGSCTNGRLEDLRAAARIFAGHRVATSVRTLIVPGSQRIKAAAEREGLADIFLEAGCEWRKPGCSMCIAMNGDLVGRDQYVVSTSNRNFVGRQGPGARTILASPLTAAASAIHGRLADPREFL